MGLKEIKKRSVAFMMPCGAPVEPRVVQSALNLVSKAALDGILCSFVGVTDRTLIHTARNILMQGFLEQTDCEWMFWMDSDMILEPRTISVMLNWAEKLDAKMLTGIYYQRAGSHRPVLWRKKATDPKTGKTHETSDDYGHFFMFPGSVDDKGKMRVCLGGPPFKADTAGFGCCLIHRDVVDAMEYPYFQFNFFKDKAGKIKESSEDFHFFIQAKKLGFQLWAVPELDCGHIGQAPIVTHRDCSIELDEDKVIKENRNGK